MATRKTTLAMRESRNTMPVHMPRKNNGPLARSLIHSLNGMVITRHYDRVDASAMASSESAKDLIAYCHSRLFPIYFVGRGEHCARSEENQCKCDKDVKLWPHF